MSADTTQTSGLGFTGQSVKRIEDERLLVGAGDYVADAMPDGVLHAAFLRSPFAHARIVNVDVSAAARMPGVHRIFTGAELNAVTNAFVPFFMVDKLYTPLYKCMSDERVRHQGDPVALVVAESRYVAEDALEMIEVEYDELRPVASIATALDAGSEPLWEKAKGNILYDDVDTYGPVDEVFAKADRVITRSFRSHRQSNQPMETRGIVVDVDPSSGHLTIRSTSQAPHFLKWAAAGLTTNDSAFSSLKKFVTNKSRRAAFLDAAKDFTQANKEKIAKQDNAGQQYQMKKDLSMLPNMARMGLGLLAADDYPTVQSVDIGGGFGAKGPVAREDVAVVAAAKLMGRSIQWIGDRVENLTDGGHAREEDFTVSMAVNDDGTLLGLKVDAVIDQGAYPAFPIGSVIIRLMWKVYFPGSYDWEAYELRTRIVSTNKGKVVPYRGPWANETWARERMVDVVAGELGLSPTDIRMKNMVGEDKLPMDMISGPSMDVTMSVKKTLAKAAEILDMNEIDRLKAEAAAKGHRLGLGIACYHEAAPGPPNFMDSIQPGTDMFVYEDGRAEVEADGRIVMYTSQVPHGQSHETTFTQVAADAFGVPMSDVELRWGDTDRSQFSFLGTGGSRGGPLGGGVMRATARAVRDQVVDAAASMLEASKDDIEITNGNIHVRGVPARGITYADVAAKVAGDKGVTTGAVFSEAIKYEGVGNGGWSVATHVALVDIDMETGVVTIPRYLVVEDCGPIINPAIVDGQVRGGVAQGIGAVFYENSHYDDQANLQATTYMDYLVPTAMEIPDIEIIHLETLSEGENDARGVGEGGMIGAPAALCNAVEDALGVPVNDQYLPPYRILEMAGVIDPD